jgi:transposase
LNEIENQGDETMAASNANAKNLSIQEVADRIEVPAKTIRKVLRANSEKENQPGRGGRWIVAESDIEKLRALINSHTAKSATVAQFSDD